MINFGVSRRIITPPWPVHLGGFAHRDQRSHGVHDNLEAKCVSLFDGTTRAVVVACDLLWVERQICEAVREIIAQRHGLAADRIMILGTHTHAGPSELNTVRARVVGEPERAYWTFATERIVEAITEAITYERPGTVEHAHGTTNVAVNRRRIGADDVTIAPNRCGPVDRALHVIVLRSAQGSVEGLLVNAACHPTVLHGNNRAISAEFPGAACRELERDYPGSTALYLQGACADCEPLVCAVGDTFKGGRGSYHDVQIAGALLAHDVRYILESAEAVTDVTLSGASETLQLDCVAPTDERYYEREMQSSEPGDFVWEWCAERRSELQSESTSELHVPVEAQCLAIGDSLRIVAVEAEIFAATAARIRARCKPGATIIAGYANGCVGYVAPPSAIAEGGYEVERSAMYYRLPGFLNAEAEQTLLEAIGRCAGGAG
jgi:hypothetical protein